MHAKFFFWHLTRNYVRSIIYYFIQFISSTKLDIEQLEQILSSLEIQIMGHLN